MKQLENQTRRYIIQCGCVGVPEDRHSCLASEKIDLYHVKLCVVMWGIIAWVIGDFSLF